MARSKSPSCFSSNYFLILTVLIFIMLLYVYIVNPMQYFDKSKALEKFSEVMNYKLIPADKLVVVQGLGVPEIPIQATKPDQTDPSSPAVDGTEDGAKSKFFFAYNECKPECCATSGGYSCNGGCPCVTKEQEKFAYRRGYNHKPSKCSYDEVDY